ncbi:MAG: DUF1553 domain-containing protein [Planctomycetota bacterium]|nr:MAG: DUF1553 domain-containing protein [Planctomycetota bacterium]
MCRPIRNATAFARWFVLVVIGIGAFAGAEVGVLSDVAAAAPTRTIRFNAQIRPIFAEFCLECHGPDASRREADLRLDVESIAKQSVIVPHKPEDSELYRRLTTSDPDERMPPAETGKRLSADQIRLIRDWIAAGAPYESHWAFEPIRHPEPPRVGDASLSEIDRFVLARLRAAGLDFAPEISRQQWIRRVTFDLIGLPPRWEEVEAFLHDNSPDAYEKVVDRLLASPRYGERWGRHWLDLARYADTLGGAAIGFTRFPFSYTYRDYVIRAFNDDVPYDRFVTEQLAADQLGLKENDPRLAALGFLTVGMQFRNPHDIIDDQIDVITRGLMGLTVACARCHDHKYDPIPTTDYYALYATLASSKPPKTLPVLGTPADTPAYRDYRRARERLEQLRDDFGREQSEVMRHRLRMQVGLYLRELAKGVPEQDLSSTFLSYRTDDLRPLILNRWRDYLKKLPDDDPVFGPWKQLAKVPPERLAQAAAELVARMKKENGDPKKFPPDHAFAGQPPRWNPRVLDAIAQRKPKSLLELADVYGAVFAEAQRQWLQGLLEAALEAGPGGTVVPDGDPRHGAINSPVLRQLRRHLYAPGTPCAVPDEIAVTLLNRPIRDNYNGRNESIRRLELTAPGAPPRGMVLREDERPGDFYVFRRGNPINRGPRVEARFLTVLSEAAPAPFPPGRRRWALARAIVDRRNPLTRRVIVNWVWQHHFGVGLVRTPDDFGSRGEPPTHPDLLDWLATTFSDVDGWSLKRLHRRIVLSRTYRQAALEDPVARRIDPDNRLLWRMPRRRLELEAMRDAMLFVSGELDLTMGGRPFDLQKRPAVPRRTVYGFVNRDVIPSLMSTFDAANPNACTAKRPETIVPQQTLFALNSDFIQDRAVAFAARARQAVPNDAAERVRWMYRRAFSRDPDAFELELALRFVGSDADQPAAWQRFAHVLLAANEFVFVD